MYSLKEQLVSVNYRCHSPFTLIGSQQRSCLPNGTWSGTAPTCVKGFYHRVFLLMFAFYKSHATKRLKVFVTHTGQTGRTPCPPPPKPLNGYYRSASDPAGGAEIIEFFCKKSYMLSGNHHSFCHFNGSWSSKMPKCVKGIISKYLDTHRKEPCFLLLG